MKEMINIMKKIRLMPLLLLASLMISLPATYAAEESSAGPDGPLSDLYIVLGAGSAGAILGLSTLSFEDEPTKNFKNVSMGAALGIILGVGIVIYNQATKTSSTIYSADLKEMSPEVFAQLSKVEFNNKTYFESYKQNEWLSFSTSF